MATFDIFPLFRTPSVRIDRAWNQLNTAIHLDSGGFPAYDILQLSEDEFRISLAVPGFKASEITLKTREGSVWVKSDREVDPNHNQYLYRGMATQGFQRTFQLSEHVAVQGARLEEGMLHIDLIRELPEALRPLRINIETDKHPTSMLEDTSKAA